MQTFRAIAGACRGLNFDGDVRISENQVDLRTAGSSPKGDRKFYFAVVPVCPALLEDEMFKG